MNLEYIRAAVEDTYEEVVALRRKIHMHPELSQQEEQTMALVSDYLTSLNISHQTYVGGYGIVAVIGNPDAEFSVGIRADMDALPILEKNEVPYASKIPGVMHACGHDIHTATLMGTAKILKSMEEDLPGAVKLFFQPAEEKGGGAKPMIEAGCLEKPPVKRVFGLHVSPDMPAGHISLKYGRMSAASTNLKIIVHGMACHGARPNKGADAIMAAANVLTGLQSIVSRSLAPTNSAVITIGTISGGTKNNIVAGEVEMTGTIRTLDFETRELVKQRVREIAQNAAAAYGATADVIIQDNYPPLITDIPTTQRMEALAREILGEEAVHILAEPSLGAEDFAYFSNAVPGTMFRLGTFGKDTGHPQMLHNEWFCPDETCMKTGMLLEVAGALTFLKEEEQR